MPRQTIALVSHSVCGKGSAEDAEFPSAVSTIVFGGEVWTTFHYVSNPSAIRLDSQKAKLKSKLSGRFSKGLSAFVADKAKSSRKSHNKKQPRSNTYYTANPATARDANNTKYLERNAAPAEVKVAAGTKNGESVTDTTSTSSSVTLSDANISAESKTSPRNDKADARPINTVHDDVSTTGTDSKTEVGASSGTYPISALATGSSATSAAADSRGNKQYKVKFWHNKKARILGGYVPILEDATDKESPKNNYLRIWFNKESPEILKARRISKARYDICTVATEVARMASVRHLARRAARAGAFATAAYAYVTAEELSPRASHGSVAAAISMACKDVAKTSMVRRVKNGDYIRLHRLFYYHYKFRGPDYYKPLDPICTAENGPQGEFVVHCKMEGPGDSPAGFEVLAKDSPLILFLKQFSADSEAKAEGALGLNQSDGYNDERNEVGGGK